MGGITRRPFWSELAASVLEHVGTSAAGLGAEEARARLKRVGPNEPAPPRRFEALRELAALLLNPLVLILLVASAVSAAFGQVLSAVIIEGEPRRDGRGGEDPPQTGSRRPSWSGSPSPNP